MFNIKGYAIANDGNMKRVAITYDVVDDLSGKPVKVNAKANNFIVDEDVLAALDKVEQYVSNIVASSEE